MLSPEELGRRRAALEELLLQAEQQRDQLLGQLSTWQSRIEEIKKNLDDIPRSDVVTPKANGNGSGHRSALVVDDSKLVAKVTASHLNSLGMEADIAFSGTEALALLARKSYDIVLMDIAMPGIDGIETCKTLRKTEALSGKKKTNVIAVTGTATRKKCMEAGFDAFYEKPLTTTHLNEIIDRYVRHRNGNSGRAV